ncbi:hypothetical protein M885DRAFT_610533 [Pelagophyceae sp. CCMP2097]|nr:hypothetical protein M885DRAFT_610533 [Pelagophyceae sp. CCMP2097]
MEFAQHMQGYDSEFRAKALVGIELAMGFGGFLFLCVSASCCGSCYVEPCVHPAGLKMLYKVNSSLCFAGVTTGMFFCFLSGWGVLLTLRRRASVMGFGHFFGAVCVTFLVAVQSAGMWGAEATLLEEFTHKSIYEEAVIDGLYQQVRVRQNRALHRSARFLFTLSVLFSIALMILAPLYFVSRDVFEDDTSGGSPEGGNGERFGNGERSEPRPRAAAPPGRSLYISAYEPIADMRNQDDERQYLGRASLPMRPIRPQFKSTTDDDGV